MVGRSSGTSCYLVEAMSFVIVLLFLFFFPYVFFDALEARAAATPAGAAHPTRGTDRGPPPGGLVEARVSPECSPKGLHNGRGNNWSNSSDRRWASV